MNDIEVQIEHIQGLVREHYHTLRILEKKIAQAGGESEAEVKTLKARERAQEEIEKLKGQLRELEKQQAVRAATTEHAALTERATAPQPAASPAHLLPPIRVFISSTMIDLQPEREAVERAVQSLDLEAVRAETIGSQTDSPYQVSRTMAQQCDIYLGIYGGRYGSIVPGDGRSITEIEYDTARKDNKPILLYHKTGVKVDRKQKAFLKSVGDLVKGHVWQDFGPDDVPGNLIDWVQRDVRAEIERHPEWAQRSSARERVLLASLGRSPGAITGLYHALQRADKPATRVLTFSTRQRDVLDAAGVCANTFKQWGVPYRNYEAEILTIGDAADAREFKGVFRGLLQQSLDSDAEVLVGITGGRTVMGALMAIVVQTIDSDRVTLYHLEVPNDIEQDGPLPGFCNLESDRQAEVLDPPEDQVKLVQVPYVRFTQQETEAD